MSEPPLPILPSPAAPGDSPVGPVVPMTFGQILDRIFRLMRSHRKSFVGIGLLPIGAMFAIYAVLFGALYLAGVFPHPPAHLNPTVIVGTIFPVILLFIPLMFLVYGLYYGASTFAAVRADHGFSVTAGEAFRHAWSKAGRYAWLMLLRALIVAIPIAACAFAIGAGAFLLGLVPRGNPNTAALFFLIPLAVLLYFGSIVYAIIVSLRLSLAYPACVCEDLTASQAIKRSGVLTKGAKGRIFLALLVIYAIGYAIFIVLYIVGMIVGGIAAVAGAGHLQSAPPWVYILLGLLVACAIVIMLLWTVLLMAAYSTAFAVFYRDQCLRTDGLPRSLAQGLEPA
jgi:hypothetical protein